MDGNEEPRVSEVRGVSHTTAMNPKERKLQTGELSSLDLCGEGDRQDKVRNAKGTQILFRFPVRTFLCILSYLFLYAVARTEAWCATKDRILKNNLSLKTRTV